MYPPKPVRLAGLEERGVSPRRGEPAPLPSQALVPPGFGLTALGSLSPGSLVPLAEAALLQKTTPEKETRKGMGERVGETSVGKGGSTYNCFFWANSEGLS